MRFDPFLYSRQSCIDHTIHQHYDDAHRMIECPKCDREFGTQKAMDQVHAQPSICR